MFSPFLRLFRRPHPVLGRLALGSLTAGLLAFAPAICAPRALGAQDAPLTLARAQAIARAASPKLRAAAASRAAVAARERQAAAVLNPALTYGREQTSRAGQGNAQHIAQLEQPLELGGQRGIRVAAARARRAAAGVALIPLALGGGEPGNELQTPMAIVILGGLLSATALNMLVLPALYWLYGERAVAPARAEADVLTERPVAVPSGFLPPPAHAG